MNVEEAISQACSSVGIYPPKRRNVGRWLTTDTVDGKRGKGDGRVIMDDVKVTAWNWRTGEKETVWLNDRPSPVERRQIAQRIEQENAEKKARAERAAHIAAQMVAAAQLGTHAYFAKKGFPQEKALVLTAADVRRIDGAYLVPDGSGSAIVMPARIGARISSVQLIWEDGTKKFLAGGEISGACHRIGKGTDTWLCEGYATGLSLRAALKALNRADTILCCFSASNVLAVSRSIKGRCYIAADNDKPMPQFDGKGTGEHYAEASGKPYLMPPDEGTDLNDLHMQAGIFAVQKRVAEFIRSVRQ